MRGIAQFPKHIVLKSRQDMLADELVQELAAAAVSEQDSLWLGRHRWCHFLRPYLNHAEQVPSELTMHGPIGFCGVHRGPEQRALNRLDQPAQDLAAPAAVDLLAGPVLHAESLERIELTVLLFESQRALRYLAETAPVAIRPARSTRR